MRHLKRKTWPYQIAMKRSYASIDEWCENMIGEIHKEWYAFDNVYAFKDEKDFIVFKLVWSHNEKSI